MFVNHVLCGYFEHNIIGKQANKQTEDKAKFTKKGDHKAGIPNAFRTDCAEIYSEQIKPILYGTVLNITLTE